MMFVFQVPGSSPYLYAPSLEINEKPLNPFHNKPVVNLNAKDEKGNACVEVTLPEGVSASKFTLSLVSALQFTACSQLASAGGDIGASPWLGLLDMTIIGGSFSLFARYGTPLALKGVRKLNFYFISKKEEFKKLVEGIDLSKQENFQAQLFNSYLETKKAITIEESIKPTERGGYTAKFTYGIKSDYIITSQSIKSVVNKLIEDGKITEDTKPGKMKKIIRDALFESYFKEEKMRGKVFVDKINTEAKELIAPGKPFTPFAIDTGVFDEQLDVIVNGISKKKDPNSPKGKKKLGLYLSDEAVDEVSVNMSSSIAKQVDNYVTVTLLPSYAPEIQVLVNLNKELMANSKALNEAEEELLNKLYVKKGGKITVADVLSEVNLVAIPKVISPALLQTIYGTADRELALAKAQEMTRALLPPAKGAELITSSKGGFLTWLENTMEAATKMGWGKKVLVMLIATVFIYGIVGLRPFSGPKSATTIISGNKTGTGNQTQTQAQAPGLKEVNPTLYLSDFDLGKAAEHWSGANFHYNMCPLKSSDGQSTFPPAGATRTFTTEFTGPGAGFVEAILVAPMTPAFEEIKVGSADDFPEFRMNGDNKLITYYNNTKASGGRFNEGMKYDVSVTFEPDGWSYIISRGGSVVSKKPGEGEPKLAYPTHDWTDPSKYGVFLIFVTPIDYKLSGATTSTPAQTNTNPSSQQKQQDQLNNDLNK